MVKLKNGELALIVKSKLEREVGKTVKLIRPIANRDWFNSTDGTRYQYNTSHGYGWLCQGDIALGMRPFPKDWLIPLSGDFEDVQEVR